MMELQSPHMTSSPPASLSSISPVLPAKPQLPHTSRPHLPHLPWHWAHTEPQHRWHLAEMTGFRTRHEEQPLAGEAAAAAVGSSRCEAEGGGGEPPYFFAELSLDAVKNCAKVTRRDRLA